MPARYNNNLLCKRILEVVIIITPLICFVGVICQWIILHVLLVVLHEAMVVLLAAWKIRLLFCELSITYTWTWIVHIPKDIVKHIIVLYIPTQPCIMYMLVYSPRTGICVFCCSRYQVLVYMWLACKVNHVSKDHTT